MFDPHALETVVSSFALVAASEMGDKTQLLAFSLATRFRKPGQVMLGILLATLANHALASAVGAWVSEHVPPKTMALVLAAIFIGFGIWALKPDADEDLPQKSSRNAVLTTFVLFFLAEMGDKTQLATVALAARFHSMLWVTTGTTAGMLVADGLAVFLGDRMAGRVKNAWVRRFAAGMFFLFGLASLYVALR